MNVAVPLVSVSGVLVHEKPLPLLAARLTAVVESVVSMLLYWSSSATPTEKVAPAVVEVGGLVVYTSCGRADRGDRDRTALSACSGPRIENGGYRVGVGAGGDPGVVTRYR